MSYYYTKIIEGSFIDIETKVIELLNNEGFGILTQIDMQQTLKKKLNIDFKKYKVLGACNPQFAYKALLAENKIGTMLPCNIIIQEHSPNQIEVSAINPLVSMSSVNNNDLSSLAKEVSAKLENVINNIDNER